MIWKIVAFNQTDCLKFAVRQIWMSCTTARRFQTKLTIFNFNIWDRIYRHGGNKVSLLSILMNLHAKRRRCRNYNAHQSSQEGISVVKNPYIHISEVRGQPEVFWTRLAFPYLRTSPQPQRYSLPSRNSISNFFFLYSTLPLPSTFRFIPLSSVRYTHIICDRACWCRNRIVSTND